MSVAISRDARALLIERLAAKGDGVGHGADGSLRFVPFTLPGERVTAGGDGPRLHLLSVDVPSPHRVAPPCPHFGVCGGCDLQHADAETYRAFKRDLVASALAREGVEAEVAPLIPCAPATRRRAVFAAQKRPDGRPTFGFFEAETHRVVDIETCKVVTPAIERRIPALRRIAATAIGRKAPLKITVIDTQVGLDVSLADAAKLTEDARRRVVSMALAEDFARITVDGEVLAESRPPSVSFGAVAVRPPPGAFLQAVRSAEEAMADLVAAHLAGAKRVADLFCGAGTFALRLAANSAVHGVENDAPALAALEAAVRGARGARLKPVTVERRDLFRRPMQPKDLKPFDGLVFDPPRAGAEAQARELAASSVKRVAAVSCNPATLARDLAILTAGGYRVLSVTPVDQFLWSHHVEAVALLER
ncbi:class I SAM-dependent RNA methyltransferase [Antarcticirhabdus aurantiaca]|uniref:Class I SAM-dependent RNA methyltransferase n=1 Tax=Antarcticirhabdus aurantiaca TaxID=2606717 RepID=A0ACD4NKI2_9HYPH|nr:class I SAM-dependent RNA methyltransferase [Antarcticirhabdus aurantiaca]WAJ27311.1 class I SAM-dependent RNA methyltransferase [Jeongeuplla avenae]